MAPSAPDEGISDILASSRVLGNTCECVDTAYESDHERETLRWPIAFVQESLEYIMRGLMLAHDSQRQ